jgi:hypothetical protein
MQHDAKLEASWGIYIHGDSTEPRKRNSGDGGDIVRFDVGTMPRKAVNVDVAIQSVVCIAIESESARGQYPASRYREINWRDIAPSLIDAFSCESSVRAIKKATSGMAIA